MDYSEIGTAARLLRGILDRREKQVVPPDQVAPPSHVPPAVAEPTTRLARIERILGSLCALSGVRGAVVSDAAGLAVAGAGTLASSDRWAAFSTVLGGTIENASRYLDSDASDKVSLGLAGGDEAVVTRFVAEARAYHLVVRCSARAARDADFGRAVAALVEALTGPASE
jgi:predicted regulator of Ras-like GTPase activity (Roadblock/LC7/MglB family)